MLSHHADRVHDSPISSSTYVYQIQYFRVKRKQACATGLIVHGHLAHDRGPVATSLKCQQLLLLRVTQTGPLLRFVVIELELQIGPLYSGVRLMTISFKRTCCYIIVFQIILRAETGNSARQVHWLRPGLKPVVSCTLQPATAAEYHQSKLICVPTDPLSDRL